MTKWEYDSGFYDLEKIDEMGRLGWELVSTRYSDTYSNWHCWFKRPIDEQNLDKILQKIFKKYNVQIGL